MLSHSRHGWHKKKGIVDWYLDSLGKSGAGVAAEHIIDTKHIGYEQCIELPPLESLGEFCPVVNIVVSQRAISRMRPKARRKMANAIHVERIDSKLFHSTHYISYSTIAYRVVLREAAACIFYLSTTIFISYVLEAPLIAATQGKCFLLAPALFHLGR